jgi:hypothetical protein
MMLGMSQIPTNGLNSISKLMAWQRNSGLQRPLWIDAWSLWFNGRKIFHPSISIYNMVHGDCAYQYWEGKDKVVPEVLDMVDWEAIGEAMSSSTLTRQHFVSKHTTGICGVGKNMKRWKKWPTDNGPRCGVEETAPHVWLCKGENACNVWQASLNNLKIWMESVQTDPAIAEAIVDSLDTWRRGAINNKM